MSGETEENISAWTVDSLRAHFEDGMASRDLRHEQRFASQEKAINLAAERVVAEVASLRTCYDALLAERDVRHGGMFEEREKAVRAALAAQRDYYDAILAERERRYCDRFETVVREFSERVLQVKAETVIAMAAAEKAISKAELATEKRFECCSADTPILCADLIWRPAGELVVGDELIAFDETSPNRRGRRFCRATVTDNSLASDALLLVTTPEGSVRCNPQHPFLVRRGRHGTWQWIKAVDLKLGDSLMYAVDTLLAKADGVWEGAALGGSGRSTMVISVEPVADGVIARLSTSTGTYIANGFAVHNSVNEFRAQQADIIQTFARKSEIDTRMIGLTEKLDSYHAQGNASMPRAEYDRAHTDLTERVLQLEKQINEKMEATAKTLDQRLSQLQAQISSVEAITR